MTYILSIDPGENTGAALGYFDAITPYRLVERYQIHGGTKGFMRWWTGNDRPAHDILVVESFILRANEFAANITPKEIEGALKAMIYLTPGYLLNPVWQPRTDKGVLIGKYPDSAKTKKQRQRVRFDFLDRFGLFKKGTENDDSNDAITHALVYLKRRKHGPTMMAFWPERVLKGPEPVVELPHPIGF